VRIVFAGTASFAVPTLERLVDAGHDLRLVITQPDRPAGRGLKLSASPVKQTAERLGLSVAQPERIRDEQAVEDIRRLEPEVLVVVAYGQIIPQSLLNVPRLGALNLHASLLPRHRGPAPIAWAILEGDERTGVTVMQMDRGVDTGPILTQAEVPIAPDETASGLEARLAQRGAELMVEAISSLAQGTIQPVRQPDEGATHAPRLRSDDGKLNIQMPAREIDRRVRALGQSPGAWLSLPAGDLKVLKGHLATGDDSDGLPVVTSDGVYVLDQVQPAGGRPMSAAAWARGRR
jgi:methionyl-tRNA formyltransferase